MSNVRLSNGSPTLERTDARVSDHPKPSACRNLFGSVDHEELKKDLKGRLQEMEEAASATWNFDFASHTPKNGTFEWKIMACTDIPDFYSRPSRASKGVCSSGNTNVDLNGNHNCGVVSPRQPSEDSDRSDSLMECREQCTGTGQRKRLACHDPSAQNKRSHTSSDERCPNLTHTAERTPRKPSPRRQT